MHCDRTSEKNNLFKFLSKILREEKVGFASGINEITLEGLYETT